MYYLLSVVNILYWTNTRSYSNKYDYHFHHEMKREISNDVKNVPLLLNQRPEWPEDACNVNGWLVDRFNTAFQH